ncbi:MAG: response regulator transcription factor [Clostridia bacterium]|nr:response regulator transcription factor [Clostridia bacterium]
MAKIWIVEDDPKIGLLIEMTMKKAGHEPLRMLDAAILEKTMKKEPLPDLLLLDLMLREKNGFTVLREWKAEKRTQRIPVIIISARAQEHDKVHGLELGAEDYITKPFGVRELQARVQAALRRLPQEPEKLVLGPLTLWPQSHDVTVDQKRAPLTQKEFEVLLYLCRRPGVTVTRGMLLNEVWGYQTQEDPSRLVDALIKTLRVKLGDTASEPRFIQTVRGAGYRLVAGDAP